MFRLLTPSVIILFRLFFMSDAIGGRFELLQKSIGVNAMHMQLLSNDRVIIFDRTDFGLSNLTLPNGKCRNDPNETVVNVDCTAHSVEYDVLANTFRALFVQTDVWCSSGAVTPNGRLIQTGGFNDGYEKVRIIEPCKGDCDWTEIDNGLAVHRWYASNQLLPDGSVIIIGGRKQFNYEFYPKKGAAFFNPLNSNISLPFLAETNDDVIENNLYPFVHLNVDGNLFIFANNKSILFDYTKSTVVKTFPVIPDGNPRSYPSTGSSVLLPLKLGPGAVEAEVLICGGAPTGSYVQANSSVFVGALKTCGRIKITDPNPQWVMETMPLARVMSDMILLPTGNVLIINGASSGTAGWDMGRDPVLNPVLYYPNNKIGSRFETQTAATIPRMYHSSALLLRDGRVLVGGSNPHERYVFSPNVLFPTELSLEAFIPSYLDAEFDKLRPKIVLPSSPLSVSYNNIVTVVFKVIGTVRLDLVTMNMVAPSFNTHSYAMGQRLLVLKSLAVITLGNFNYEIRSTLPGSGILAPSGFYMLFVVHQGIPSEGIWIHIS